TTVSSSLRCTSTRPATPLSASRSPWAHTPSPPFTVETRTTAAAPQSLPRPSPPPLAGAAPSGTDAAANWQPATGNPYTAALMSNLFTRKPLEILLDEMKGEHRLRRVLGPVQLTSLGIGAIIGAGIFVATGAAAHNVGGPALMMSYVVAGSACVCAALCYAEFASMVPVAGSAYTYAYTTLGELFAWIIGWDR